MSLSLTSSTISIAKGRYKKDARLTDLKVKSIDRQALKVTKTIGALVVESSGETPQKAAVDDRSYMPDTNPRKLPQLRVVESNRDARD